MRVGVLCCGVDLPELSPVLLRERRSLWAAGLWRRGMGAVEWKVVASEPDALQASGRADRLDPPCFCVLGLQVLEFQSAHFADVVEVLLLHRCDREPTAATSHEQAVECGARFGLSFEHIK